MKCCEIYREAPLFQAGWPALAAVRGWGGAAKGQLSSEVDWNCRGQQIMIEFQVSTGEAIDCPFWLAGESRCGSRPGWTSLMG